MAKKRKLGISVFVVILTILMLAVIIFTAMVNFKFSSSAKSGTLFGKHIYIMENNDMAPELSKWSAVISDSGDIQVLTEGSVILFKQNKNFDSVMRISEVVHNTDSTVYKVSSDAEPDKTIEIDKSAVIAKCNKESQNLGKILNFLKSTKGLIAGLLLPCLILLTVIIVKIVSVRKSSDELEDNYENEEEDFDDEDDDEEDSLLRKRINPLFIPDGSINQGEEFEKKKSSIAKNFAQKPGAVKSREVRRIPAQKESENAVERFKAAVEEKPSAPVMKKPTLAPDGSNPDINEKMAAIKAALSQGNGKTDPDNSRTMKINISDESKNYNTEHKPARTENVQSKKVSDSTKKKDDNIKSIDDLIRILEEEKKKL